MKMLKKSASFVISLLLLAVPLLAILNRQNIYDWWTLRGYKPQARIVELNSQNTMTGYAAKVFYVNKPDLLGKSDFNNKCTSSEQTIVLGCYIRNRGIYLLSVSDSRLSGVEQVTAAHEMLHAVYDRLSIKERSKVDQMTESTYNKLSDQRIKMNVESYRSRDASVVPNELHSILATEVRELPAELEQYYKKYFYDRLKIVSFSEQYEQEFTIREAKVAEYDQQLKTLKATIDSQNNSLDSQGWSIDQESKILDTLLAAKKISEYNAAIPNYQRIVERYNSLLKSLKANISTYNSTVEIRNAVVGEEKSLYQSINSNLPDSR